MKKIIFLLCFMSVYNLKAQELQPVETEMISETLQLSTFYGSKASNRANNPCKGATIRVCGTISSQLQEVNDKVSLLVEEIRDEKNQIIKVEKYFIDGNLQEAAWRVFNEVNIPMRLRNDDE
ncbi:MULTISPECIES: hypothetical protein [Bacteroides]|uniref:hypothetical protein n=1 Tax=Bacteroides TaxID=816 RepID=UPI001E039603|nr:MULTISPECIES: hypothetical protein [Bacteroides]HJD91734.1 hypothetical protein [Bacteroides coprosuis]